MDFSYQVRRSCRSPLSSMRKQNVHRLQVRENDEPETLLKTYVLIVPVSAVVILLFQVFCETLVAKFRVSPFLLAPNVVLIALSGSMLFSTNFPLGKNPGEVLKDIGRKNGAPEHIGTYSVSDIGRFVESVLRQTTEGVAGFFFSGNVISSIPYSTALAIASPILCATVWSGAFLSVILQRLFLGFSTSTAAYMAAHFTAGDVKTIDVLIPVNGLITFSVLVGNVFLLNRFSLLVGILGLCLSNCAVMAFTAWLGSAGLPVATLPSNAVCILLYVGLEGRLGSGIIYSHRRIVRMICSHTVWSSSFLDKKCPCRVQQEEVLVS